MNSDGVYYTLLERKLIKIAGRKDSPGRPLMYSTTKEFMQYLGINSLEDLPKMEEIQGILENDENVFDWDANVADAKENTLFEFDEEKTEIAREEEGTENRDDAGTDSSENTAEEETAAGESPDNNNEDVSDDFEGRKSEEDDDDDENDDEEDEDDEIQ